MHNNLARFGGNATSNIDPLVIALVAVCCLLILLLPRRYIFVPLFVSWFFVPPAQKLVIAGINLIMFRIVIFAAVIRAITSKPGPKAFRWVRMDTLFVLWCLSSVVMFTLLYGQVDALVNRLGFMLNAFGVYFPMRVLVWDEEDIDRIFKIFAWCSVIIAICMVLEQFTRHNMFSVFGGVPSITDVREGKLRSQGPFAHPILAGSFGAMLVPLFVGLWWQKSGSKFVAFLGIASGVTIAVTSASSTALMACAAGIGALLLWKVRKYMRVLRWGIVITLVGLHLVMKAPVWALIGRVDVVGGSSSYHRYQLINQFILRFWEWWLVGIKSTDGWGWDLWDTSNMYVETGVTGGLLTLALFIAILVQAFKLLGRARMACEEKQDLVGARRYWAMGSCIFANMVAFIGISYFDQTALAWYSLLAMVTSASLIVLPSLATEDGLDLVPTTPAGVKLASASAELPTAVAEVQRSAGVKSLTQGHF